MAASIIVDQAAHPAGVAGKAREDLDTGLAVTLTAAGGPFSNHLWSIVHKPVDIALGTRSGALLSAPTAAVTSLAPIDVPGTHLIQLLVDSGAGLGASAADVARITFYAGMPGSKLFGPLSASPDRMPRRIPAFQETLEHNVNDAIDPLGNPEGWSKEWQRWFYAIERMWETKAWAMGRVTLTGAGATLVRGVGATVLRTGVGLVTVTLTPAMPDANYLAEVWPMHADGECWAGTELAGSFVANRNDSTGAPADLDFGFAVYLGI